jgi:hypothetical protein
MAKKKKTLADLMPGDNFRFKSRKEWYQFIGRPKGGYKYFRMRDGNEYVSENGDAQIVIEK